MWVWEIAGCGYFGGVGAGGTPPPEIFLAKNVIFLHISPIFEVMGLKKTWGVSTPPLGAPSPLKFFWRSKLGLARCFHSHFATVGLVVFEQLLALTLALSPGSTP